MIKLSYPVQDELTDPDESWLTAQYLKGPNDFAFVAFWIIAFTYIRAFFMKSIFTPMGKGLGIRGSKLERFEEQMYILAYYIVSWTCGMVTRGREEKAWGRMDRLSAPMSLPNVD
jgi:acyl-CoA-dependent ceramide synthase